MKRQLGTLARVLVSVGILVYLFNKIFRNEVSDQVPDLDALSWAERARVVWSVGPRELWKEFTAINPVWFLLAVACVGVVCCFGILRWQLILRVQGLELKFARVTSIFFIGQFFNAFMLGATGGDVVKAWYVAHDTHHKKAEAVTAVVVDRLIGLLSLFLIAIVMMAAFYHRVFDDPKMVGFGVAAVVITLLAVVFTAAGFSRRLADKLPGTLRRMLEAYRAYASHPGVLVKSVLLSFCVHTGSMLGIVCIGKGLGITAARVSDYFLYLPIINTVTALPISISGLGVREGMYTLMFGEVGVTASQAVALSLLGFLAGLVWSIVGSGFYLTHRKELPPAEIMATGE